MLERPNYVRLSFDAHECPCPSWRLARRSFHAHKARFRTIVGTMCSGDRLLHGPSLHLMMERDEVRLVTNNSQRFTYQRIALRIVAFCLDCIDDRVELVVAQTACIEVAIRTSSFGACQGLQHVQRIKC